MKQWVIGDIHGCSKTLKALIEQKIKPAKEDQLIFLGDYIDRGNNSKKVLDYLINLQIEFENTVFLRGNHEEYMINAYENAEKVELKFSLFSKKNKDLKLWKETGGDKTLESFKVKKITEIPSKYIAWIKQTEYYYQTPKYIIVHAGLNFDIDYPLVDKYTMLRIRDFKSIPEKVNNRIVVHGHVPLSLDFIIATINDTKTTFIAIDNGCVYNKRLKQGNLLALELNTLELIIQPNIDF